jgi:hypothetical protein
MEAKAPRILVEGGPVHRRVNHVLAGLIGFMLGGAVGFIVLLHLIHKTTITNCKQIEVVKHGLVLTLTEADRFTQSSPVRSQAEKQASAMFYRDALGRLKPHRC